VACNFVTEKLILDVIMSREFIAERFIVCLQRWSKTLAATNLKMMVNWKQL